MTSPVRVRAALVERSYAIVALFALTQGPVLRIWWSRALEEGIPVRAPIVATYALVQLPALMMLGRAVVPVAARRVLWLMAAWLGWTAASVVWSIYGAHSVVEVLSLLLTCAFGLWLATRFEAVELMFVLLVATTVGVVTSVVAMFGGFEGAVGPKGEWIGIYYNRNSLAPVASLGAFASICLLVDAWRGGRGRRAAALVVCVALHVVVALGTRSETTVAACVIGLAIVVLVGAAANGAEQGVAERAWWTVRWMVVLVPWAVALLARWFGRFTRPFGIGGRENIWMASVDGFLERPWFGWGWMAAWESLTFFPEELWLWRELTGPWSHSSYYDIVLGGGIVAVVLFAAFVATSLSGHRHVAPEGRLGSVYAGLAVYVLAAATQESFIIGNHVLLALMIAGLTGPWLAPAGHRARPTAAGPAPK